MNCSYYDPDTCECKDCAECDIPGPEEEEDTYEAPEWMPELEDYLNNILNFLKGLLGSLQNVHVEFQRFAVKKDVFCYFEDVDKIINIDYQLGAKYGFKVEDPESCDFDPFYDTFTDRQVSEWFVLWAKEYGFDEIFDFLKQTTIERRLNK